MPSAVSTSVSVWPVTSEIVRAPLEYEPLAIPIFATPLLLTATTAVSISVNGRVQVVRVGKLFPSSNPLFRLVGITRGGARIGIASGSYSSGAQTVSLVPGRTMTLVDTADGVRYRIRLLSAA